MKANELMIGDWVHVEAHRGFNAQNVKVETIPDNDGDNKYGHHYGHIGMWLDGCDNDFRDVEAKHLQPIPLTPEILEKNGFEDIGDDTYQLEEKPCWFWVDFFRHNYGCEYDTSTYEYEDSEHRLKLYGIPSVHELQHALRLCGIEKEIEL